MSTDNKPVKKYRLCKDYVTPRFTFLKDTPVAYIGGNNYVVGLEVFSEKEMQDNTQWFSPIEEEPKENPCEIWLSRQKLDAMMENVFNAARLLDHSKPEGEIRFYKGYKSGHHYAVRYPTFADYKNSLPENKYLPTDTVPLKSNAIEESGHISSLEKYPSTLPSIDEAGIIAIKISETVNPELTSQEQAFFIAGFQECIKWQLKKESAPKDKVDGKEGRDWEILSVLADDGNPIYYPSRDIIDACLKRNGERIHSVKRNSDQITFTVGDIIEGAQLEAHNTVSHHPTEIKSIRVINGTIGLAYGNGGEVIISHAKKLPESQPKEQVPLFTTEDGVKVMEWDTFYYVPESMEWVNSCCRAMPQPPESFKYFSTP